MKAGACGHDGDPWTERDGLRARSAVLRAARRADAQAARGVGASVRTAIERVRVAGGADALDRARLAQDPGDAGQRLEVVGAGAFRGEQQEQEVDRLAVEGLEVDRLLEARDQAEQAVEFGSLPCGMAMPSPMPVEPRRSRCSSASKTARSSRPGQPGRMRARAPAGPASCRSRAGTAPRPRGSENPARASLFATWFGGAR